MIVVESQSVLPYTLLLLELLVIWQRRPEKRSRAKQNSPQPLHLPDPARALHWRREYQYLARRHWFQYLWNPRDHLRHLQSNRGRRLQTILRNPLETRQQLNFLITDNKKQGPKSLVFYLLPLANRLGTFDWSILIHNSYLSILTYLPVPGTYSKLA